MGEPAAVTDVFAVATVCDGISVLRGTDGFILVFPAGGVLEGGSVLSACPCCGRPIASLEDARMIAEVYR